MTILSLTKSFIWKLWFAAINLLKIRSAVDVQKNGLQRGNVSHVLIILISNHWNDLLFWNFWYQFYVKNDFVMPMHLNAGVTVGRAAIIGMCCSCQLVSGPPPSTIPKNGALPSISMFLTAVILLYIDPNSFVFVPTAWLLEARSYSCKYLQRF